MSLLEDIFLRDEADEAKELERIIDGDEYDDKPQLHSDSDDNSVKDDEAEEEKKRVDPTSTKSKRAIRNPRFILNPARLNGPRGIQVIPDHFKDFKFKGKGHEKEDLDLVLKNLEHWAYRLYPKFQFEDCLKKIETLGKKRPVMVHLHKIRSDQYNSEETVVQKDSSDEDTPPVEREEDEFDKLLQQQIDLARSTPGPGSAKKSMETSVFDRSAFTVPKGTSSPSINEQQRERMMRSRRLAEERRLARSKNNNTLPKSTSGEKGKNITNTNEDSSEMLVEHRSEAIEEIGIITDDVTTAKKCNRTNIIESSDEEDALTIVNESVTVDIHASVSTAYNDHEAKVKEITQTNDFDSIVNDISEADNDTVNINVSVEMKNNDKSYHESDLSNTPNIEEHSNLSNKQIIIDNSEVDPVDENISVDNEIYNNDNHKQTTKCLEKSEIYPVSEIIENLNDTTKNITPSEYTKQLEDRDVMNKQVSEISKSGNNKEIITDNGVGVAKDLEDLMDVDFTDDF